ncbi:HAD family hydrolase [Gammaproteobacteria bacterium AH-315-C21]|nr:HAD family hydrolase [Gammaproteobacteria bacterium AH-315-C21]
MALALFDLDNTLLDGDSDYLWGQFLIELGVVNADTHDRENHRFYEDYKNGTLDIDAFLAFQLAPLAQHSRTTLEAWHQQFMAEKIKAIMLDKSKQLIAQHRDAGDTLLIITATNRFVTGPIATAFGIETLIATEPEEKDGKFSGRYSGTPCFREGKVVRLNEWRAKNNHSLADSYFYSDSHNDLPLLKMVDHPVAVDADEALTEHAQNHGWGVISLR